MRIVVALGGNALLERGQPLDAEVQRRNVQRAARALAPVAAEHELVITHGNGPQVGLLALQNEAYRDVAPYPLDVLGAESEGMIGYLIEEDLRNELPDRPIATLLTQVLVDADDPAFVQPSKPIGPVYSEQEACRLASARGWTVGPDGVYWRRLVPSPEPRRILEMKAIELLVGAGITVICAGGGGVPVIRDAAGALRGVEAVIDKDLSAALLAAELFADALICLTDVDAVYEDWPTPGVRPIRQATVRQLRGIHFSPGSMGPKVEAACRFVERRGGLAAVGALTDVERILRGEAGTRVTIEEPADV